MTPPPRVGSIDVTADALAAVSPIHKEPCLHYWGRQRKQREKEKHAQSDVDTGYWLNTSTGVRHNRSCPNYRNTKRGRPCGADEGKACGMCGG